MSLQRPRVLRFEGRVLLRSVLFFALALVAPAPSATARTVQERLAPEIARALTLADAWAREAEGQRNSEANIELVRRITELRDSDPRLQRPELHSALARVAAATARFLPDEDRRRELLDGVDLELERLQRELAGAEGVRRELAARTLYLTLAGRCRASRSLGDALEFPARMGDVRAAAPRAGGEELLVGFATARAHAAELGGNWQACRTWGREILEEAKSAHPSVVHSLLISAGDCLQYAIFRCENPELMESIGREALEALPSVSRYARYGLGRCAAYGYYYPAQRRFKDRRVVEGRRLLGELREIRKIWADVDRGAFGKYMAWGLSDLVAATSSTGDVVRARAEFEALLAEDENLRGPFGFGMWGRLQVAPVLEENHLELQGFQARELPAIAAAIAAIDRRLAEQPDYEVASVLEHLGSAVAEQVRWTLDPVARASTAERWMKRCGSSPEYLEASVLRHLGEMCYFGADRAGSFEECEAWARRLEAFNASHETQYEEGLEAFLVTVWLIAYVDHPRTARREIALREARAAFERTASSAESLVWAVDWIEGRAAGLRTAEERAELLGLLEL